MLRGSMNLSGIEVRPENVQLLASLLGDGELAEKLERAIDNDNSIVALSLADRERIVEVLASYAPSGLMELHTMLVMQLKQRRDRDRKEQNMRVNQERIQRRRDQP